MKPINCTTAQQFMMKKLDGVITAEEEQQLHQHLETCQQCAQDFKQIYQTKEVTQSMKRQLLPEMAWEDYWSHLYNRLERGIAWILISIGLILILGYAAVDFVVTVVFNPKMGLVERVGITALILGGIILFISVLREKLMTRKVDKYREIQR